MAVAVQYLEQMITRHLLGSGSRVLDIGCSNLYSADPSAVAAFLAHFGVTDPDYVARLSAESASQTAFLGDLFTRCGLTYHSLDVAADFETTIFDLNKDRLSRRFRNRFDLVLNFGTTEHVLNQANAFKVIHDATRQGGVMYHQLPAAGHTNHGYFVYTGRFFFDLAGYNKYEILSCWHDEGLSSRLSQPVADYTGPFPCLKDVLPIAADEIPDATINIIFKRTRKERFVFPMDLSTTFIRSER